MVTLRPRIKVPKRGVRRIKNVNYFVRRFPLSTEDERLLAAVMTRPDMIYQTQSLIHMLKSRTDAKEKNQASKVNWIKTTEVDNKTKTRPGGK